MPFACRILVSLASLVTLLALALGRASASEPGDWRAARWGMTEDEVLRALAGTVKKLPEPVKLADGNVIAMEAPDEEVGGFSFHVRLVFDGAGKLALVSLKSDPGRNLRADAFDSIRKAMAEKLGRAGVYSSDENFIDMRQETWRMARTRVDVKFIPGTVVVMYSPNTQR
jgi:hypothetical protein